MSYEIKGHIKEIGDTKEFGKNGFQKRQLILSTDEKYPQDLAIDFVQDKCKVLDKFTEGELVDIGINLRGNFYNGRYFVNIQGWKINSESGSEPESAVDKYKDENQTDNQNDSSSQNLENDNDEEKDDTLPF